MTKAYTYTVSWNDEHGNILSKTVIGRRKAIKDATNKIKKGHSGVEVTDSNGKLVLYCSA